MLIRSIDEDTICALSTPPGVGGIAVLRVSGSRAFEISRRLCSFLPELPESHRIYYGICRSSVTHDALDEVLVACFAEGRSFTGEETTEISCHGGAVISALVLKELIRAGARLANRGEFTYRAFMNGRLDLVQAESVLALIDSRSQQSAKVALRQLQGHLSKDFARIEDDLLWILAHLEASIDFSTEDIEIVSPQELIDRSAGLLRLTENLVASYSKGRLLREGLEVVLAGRPNVGKSSILNAFLREDRAIVTSIAGTTRDTIEGRLSVRGVPVTFVDTAGLRETENEIEKMGIARSQKAMSSADFVFYVLDLSSGLWREDAAEFASKARDRSYFLVNKVDLPGVDGDFAAVQKCLGALGIPGERVFAVSALKNEGFDALERLISSFVDHLDSESSNVVTQARHLEALQKIHSCLVAAIGLIKGNSSPEFVAFELQEAVRAIHELLGKEFNEQVIERIFKEFCLGK